ncbi:MAG: hypothetical protein IJ644_01410 [Oscillospiraceae bacterium]|nr:hypothetical protein [Oscillospiraceae bacterium]
MKVKECMNLLCRFNDTKQLKVYFTDDDCDLTYNSKNNFDAYQFGFSAGLCHKSQINFISEALLEQEVFKIYALETDAFVIRLKPEKTNPYNRNEESQEIVSDEELPL